MVRSLQNRTRLRIPFVERLRRSLSFLDALGKPNQAHGTQAQYESNFDRLKQRCKHETTHRTNPRTTRQCGRMADDCVETLPQGSAEKLRLAVHRHHRTNRTIRARRQRNAGDAMLGPLAWRYSKVCRSLFCPIWHPSDLANPHARKGTILTFPPPSPNSEKIPSLFWHFR